MRYFGSKVSAIERVYQLISTRIGNGSFCDPFGGIGTVGSYFKANGFSVCTCDVLKSAYYFQVARVERNRMPSFRCLREVHGLRSSADVVSLMNDKKERDGWFVREYSSCRNFFTEENARRIEACRLRIASWDKRGWLTTGERAVLYSSLINSMDAVANTAGTYYAYLKGWHRKALLPFRFKLLPATPGDVNCKSFHASAEEIVAKRAFDVLYLDPPYNERSYSRYYHLPETIANAEAPRVHGKSGIPNGHLTISDFNRPSRARIALETLLEKARFRLLAFHYSDDGLICRSEIRKILSAYGRVQEFVLESKGYTTVPVTRTVEHRLYLVSHG